MAVATAPLVLRLVAAMNPPGTTTPQFADAEDEEDNWLLVLANAFWMARLKGFFTDYRLSTDYAQILTVVGTDDMPDELQQLIILVASIEALRARLLETNSVFRVKSGEEEFEVQTSATLLNALLASRLKDLDDLHEHLVTDARAATNVGLIDLVLERNDYSSAWVGA